MIGPSVRLWRIQDVDAIANIMASQPLWQRYGVRMPSAGERLRRLYHSGEEGLVSLDPETGGARGFVLFNNRTFGDCGYIRLLGVALGNTSHGVGRVLLEAVESTLVHREVDRLVLLCAEWNHEARRFYERQGFVAAGVLPNWVMDGTDEVLYAKHLGLVNGRP